MKKRFLFILIFILSLSSPAHALVTYNCNAWTGGDTRALDYLSVGDLNNNDRALIVYTSGTSTYLGLAQYESSGITAENTGTHPYYVRPDDYVSSGVWVEIPLSWVDLNATVTLLNLTVTGELSASSFEADFIRSGASLVVDPPSGATLPANYFGAIIRHDSASWDWWALPAISGTSIRYVKFVEGAAGSGITLQTSDSEPFLGNGISGTSTLVLPAGSQFESATLYGLASGTSKYWFVEITSSWETRP